MWRDVANRAMTVALLVLAMMSVTATAQEKDGNYYRAQYVKWHKAHLADTTDVWPMVNLADLYADDDNPMRSLPQALDYINRAESRYVAMVKDNMQFGELRRLQKKKITLVVLRERKKEISEKAKRYLESGEAAKGELEQYLGAAGVSQTMVSQARVQRVKAAYRAAQEKNTLQAYAHFVERYPGTEEAQLAEAQMILMADSLLRATREDEESELTAYYEDNEAMRQAVTRRQSEEAFATAKLTNTVEGYQKFLADYPASTYSVEALERVDALLAGELARLSTAQEYADFALANKESHLGEEAIDKLYNKVISEKDIQAARLFLENFTDDPRYNDVYRMYYMFHSFEGNYMPIAEFRASNPDFPFPELVRRDLNETADLDGVELNKPFDESKLQDYAETMKMFQDRGLTFVLLQRALQNLIEAKDWEHAQSRYRQLGDCFTTTNKEAYKSLGALLDSEYVAEKAPIAVTLGKGDITGVAALPDDKTILYSVRSAGGSAIAKAVKTGERWKAAGEEKVAWLTMKDVVLYSVYDGGRKMLLGSGGDVWEAEYGDGGWKLKGKLPYPVNSDGIDCDAFMLPDGSGILIASDRQGGFNLQQSGSYYHGDTALATDLYYIPREGEGWGTPQNLGNKINTAYSERHPVLSKDMRTLYFVSDCSGGLGYGDVYVATRKAGGKWGEWEEVRNLGKEANSAYWEGPLSLSRNEAHLYICSRRGNTERACYRVPTGRYSGEDFVMVSIPYESAEKLDCRIYDSEGNVVASELEGGEIKARLARRKDYWLSVIKGERWLPVARLSVENAEKTDVKGFTAAELKGKEHELKKIEEGSQSSLGERELKGLVAFMKANEGVSVILSVSMPGAEKKKAYLASLECGNDLKARMVSEGIAADRVMVVGYGNRGMAEGQQKPRIAVKFEKK